MAAQLKVVDHAGGVRSLIISNPARRNAIDDEFLAAFDAALSAPKRPKAFLVRGDGEATFCAGYNLTTLTTYDAHQQLPDERVANVLTRLMNHPTPSVALVNGPAFGAGCELAMACDFRVGDPNALLSMPPAKLGVVYSLEGLRRFSDRIGEAATRFLFLTGRRVRATDAMRLGLLDVLEETPADAAREAMQLCEELAAAAPLAIAGMKRGFELLHGATPEARAEYEALRRTSFNSADAREGRAAMLEKRPATFTGK